MSKQVSLSAQPRTSVGKGDAKRLRRDGRVPAILYGHGIEPLSVSVTERELYRAMHGPAGRNALIAIDAGDGPILSVVRDIQVHPVRRDYLHVDFIAVDRNARIEVEVPVHLVGQDDVERDGGFLNQVRQVVPILVRPLDTPDFIELSVAGMGVGDVKRLSDVIAFLPEGAELADDPDRVIVTINAPAVSATDAASDAAAAAGAASGDGDASA